MNGKEIDIYIPELNIGIEYDGSWAHKNVDKDKNKDKLCESVGVPLYRVRAKQCPTLKANKNTTIIYCDEHNENSFIEALQKLFQWYFPFI